MLWDLILNYFCSLRLDMAGERGLPASILGQMIRCKIFAYRNIERRIYETQVNLRSYCCPVKIMTLFGSAYVLPLKVAIS